MILDQRLEQIRSLQDDTTSRRLLRQFAEIIEKLRLKKLLTQRPRVAITIMNRLGRELHNRAGLDVAPGIDVIGDYLTEVNVTSPTCIRELDTQYGSDIAGQVMDAIAARLPATTP